MSSLEQKIYMTKNGCTNYFLFNYSLLQQCSKYILKSTSEILITKFIIETCVDILHKMNKISQIDNRIMFLLRNHVFLSDNSLVMRWIYVTAYTCSRGGQRLLREAWCSNNTPECTNLRPPAPRPLTVVFTVSR